MLLAGLDEAGRGPVIGPLVIGCVIMDEKNLHMLEEIGVDDSKKITPKKRTYLAEQIKVNCFKFQTLIITAEQINEMHYKKRYTLNQIEEIGFAKLLNEMGIKPEKIYLDACDVNEERFGQSIKKLLKFSPKKIISKHKGDSLFKIVGAASILAKTKRDEIIKNYSTKYGNIGSGYPSDPYTKKFLQDYYKNNKDFPPIVRTWWKTATNIVEANNEQNRQKKLTDF